ncbi:MAG TPA: hypothetical protein VI278_12165, partial [Nitrososphaeraceae archaeon]
MTHHKRRVGQSRRMVRREGHKNRRSHKWYSMYESIAVICTVHLGFYLNEIVITIIVTMRKAAGGTTILFVAVSLILLLLFVIPDNGLTLLFNNDPVYGQQPVQDNNNKSQSRKQRLGTDNILSLPYSVKLVYGKGQNV